MDLQNIKHLNLQLHFSLHSAIDSGNEADFQGYSRISIPLDETNWIESIHHFINRNAISFPSCSHGEGRVDVIGICESTEVGYWDILYFIVLAEEIYITEGRSLIMPPATLFLEKKAFAMMRWKTQATILMRNQPMATLTSVIHTAPAVTVAPNNDEGSVKEIINVPLFEPIKVVQPIVIEKVDHRRHKPVTRDSQGNIIKPLAINSLWYYKSRYKNAVTETSKASIIDSAILNLDSYDLKLFDKWKSEQSFHDYDPNTRIISREDKAVVKSASEMLTKVWYYKGQYKIAKTDEGREAINERALQNLLTDTDKAEWTAWLLSPDHLRMNAKVPSRVKNHIKSATFAPNAPKPIRATPKKYQPQEGIPKKFDRRWYWIGLYKTSRNDENREAIREKAEKYLSAEDYKSYIDWLATSGFVPRQPQRKGRPKPQKAVTTPADQPTAEPLPKKKTLFFYKNRFKKSLSNTGRKLIINKALIGLSPSDGQKFMQWALIQPPLSSDE